jgi:predicted O-linked N-acetylglucosamine transferase (SPINDLY family)
LLAHALAHHQAGRIPAAAALYAQARALAPKSFEAHHLGGAAAVQLGQLAEAEKLLARALALNERVAGTHMCLGLAHAALGRVIEAEKSLRRSLELDAKNHEAWAHLASLLVAAGQLDDAGAAYERASHLKPDFAQALTGLGSVRQLCGRHAEAIALHTRALALEPSHPKARLARAQACQSLHRLDEALADLAAQLARQPDDLEARSHRLMLLNYSADMTREKLFSEHRAFGEAAAAEALKNRGRRSVAADPKFPGTPQFTADAAAAERRPPSVAGIACPKIRVAFLSPDLRAHSVAFFLEPLLRHLDRTRFEVFLYHDHFITDAASARLRALAHGWRNFIGQTNEAVAARIHADAPDILVDLAGHTGLNRLPLFARRLAPTQVAYLGYPATTGLAEMDFRFTDALVDPLGEADAFHTEKLIRFAPTAWAYSPPSEILPPGRAGGADLTFGSFNNFSKVNDTTLRLWAKILRETPGSRLLLKSFGLDPAALRPRLIAAGLDPARVEWLAPTATTAAHLALYARVDIALDPFPYHGTTTTCEALWMGVPVVTLAGDRHAARVGVSLLTAAGHPELIAHDADDYVRLASALAGDSPRLAALHTGLRRDLENSPLLDHRAQASRFGDALLACWERRRAVVTP